MTSQPGKSKPERGNLGMCAVSTCRSPATVRLCQGVVVLTLCKRHVSTYTSIGYRECES